MTSKRPRARGQPLVVLAALLLGWAGARITGMGAPGEGPNLPEAVLTVGTATAAPAEPIGGFFRPGPQSYPVPVATYLQPSPAYAPRVQYIPMWYRAPTERPPGLLASDMQGRGDDPRFFSDFPSRTPLSPMERAESLPGGDLPPLGGSRTAAARYGEPNTLLGGRIGKLIGDHARWSMDAWALLRDNGDKAPAAGTLPATYGVSQAGAVIRYRLSMSDARQPSAYLRTTATLGGLSETSAALGLSIRPLPRVPVIAAVEGRITEQAGTRRVQPAILAVTALPPIALPGALRAEVYAQGGYVAGRYATPFADGQVRVDRPLLDWGRAQARIGGGAWGGMQKGASRLDAGPGATVSLPLSSKVFGRMALDWRFRVAGDAEPGSGPALTVAAGF